MQTLAQEQGMMNIPNSLTLIRIFLIPIFVLAFYLPGKAGHLAAVTIFTLAAITDWLDGYFARRLNQTSVFGAILDPIADKLMVAVALIMIVSDAHLPLLAIPAAVIVGREIVISGLREWMAEIGKRTNIQVSNIAKIKTIVQMSAIGLLLLYWPGFWVGIGIAGYILLYVAAILTLWTMTIYLKVAWPDLI